MMLDFLGGKKKIIQFDRKNLGNLEVLRHFLFIHILPTDGSIKVESVKLFARPCNKITFFDSEWRKHNKLWHDLIKYFQFSILV